MKFFLFLQNEEVGYSLLESPDDPMAIISGEFFPNENYQKYSSIFAEYTKIRFSGFPKKIENIEKIMADLNTKIKSFNPKVISETEITLEANTIVLEDFSIEYGEKIFDLAAILSRKSFDEFFGR